MFFKFMLIAAIGIALVQLGAATTQATILLMALKPLLGLMVIAALVASAPVLWRQLKRHR